MKLQGKNIILTGASRGFGEYLAHRLWEEGANLLLVSRHSHPAEHTLFVPSLGCHQTVAYYPIDLSLSAAPSLVVNYAMNKLGAVDGLINNAAIQGPVGKTWEQKQEDWDECLFTDLLGPALLSRATVLAMLKQGHGKIISLSGGGAASTRPNFSAYATAKAGLVRFSECLAAELKDTGIDVNCVAPGAMLTDMTKGQDIPGLDQAQSDAHMEKAADLIIWLLSEESNGVTGRLISAVWDDWQSFPGYLDRLKNDPDVFTLRREIGWRS